MMSQIEETYKADLVRVAKKYAATGTDWRDAYQEILVAVYDRVLRQKVPIEDKAKMVNTINQRAIDQSRKALLYRQRYKHVAVVAETARCSESPITISEEMRITELKARIRSSLPVLDARIVTLLAFPSVRLQQMARRQPSPGMDARQPRDREGNFAAWSYDIRRWHVAKFVGVSDARVREAVGRAKGIVGSIIEEEDHVKAEKTICQMCNRERDCRLVRCDTRHLHPKGTKLTGKKGTAKLSVCPECEEKHGKEERSDNDA